MVLRSIFFCSLLIFGFAAGELIEISDGVNNFLDPQTQRPIDNHNKPPHGGFQIEDQPNNGGFQVSDNDSGQPATQEPNDDDGVIPVEIWDWSKKPTKKPFEDKPISGGFWGSIIGGWKDVLDSKKKAIVNTVNSAIDVVGNVLKATKNTADQLIEAKQKSLNKIHVDGTFLKATKGIVDKIFDKKQKFLDSLRIKQKQEQSIENEAGVGRPTIPNFTWNEPNDIAGDIFDEVDWNTD